MGQVFRYYGTDKIYAIRIWRLVIYRSNKTPSLHTGGIVCNWHGKRITARHLGGRWSWISRGGKTY